MRFLIFRIFIKSALKEHVLISSFRLRKFDFEVFNRIFLINLSVKTIENIANYRKHHTSIILKQEVYNYIHSYC